MSSIRLTFTVALVAGAALAACGGASDTDFGSRGDDSGGSRTQGGSSTQGGSTQGGSSQGGTSGASGSEQGGTSQGGSSQGGSASGGSSQGGSDTGGSPQGGSSQGGSSQGGSDTGGSATGGASGTSTGGAGGTDPIGGTGGMPGGSGPGGSGGTSGRGGGGQGGRDCTATIASAQAALVAAQVCNPVATTPKCAGSVQDLCGCTVPVNDPESEATKSYLAQREAAVHCGVACITLVCPEPTTATCGFGGATTNIVVAQSRCTYTPR